MLMSIMAIVCYVTLGLMGGIVLMSLVATAGARSRCDNCILKVFIIGGDEDERKEKKQLDL